MNEKTIFIILFLFLALMFAGFLIGATKEMIRSGKEQREAEERFSKLVDSIQSCNSLAAWQHWADRVNLWAKDFPSFKATIIELQKVALEKGIHLISKTYTHE